MSSRGEQVMQRRASQRFAMWVAIVASLPVLANARHQTLRSTVVAVLPCWCRAGSRAILKVLIVLILDREQHGSTAFLRRIYYIGDFHLAISIPTMYFILVYICRLFSRLSRAAVPLRPKTFFLNDL